MSVDEAVRVTVFVTIAFAAGRVHVTVGGVTSRPEAVVPEATVDEAEKFPTLSWAVT